MDTIEVFPDPPPPAGLVIPSNVVLALPGRSLTVSELFQYGFPSPFTIPRDSAHSPAWSDSPLHNINAVLLLSWGLRNRDSTLYEQLSAPLPSTPMPPPPPEHDGSYPEDQDREDNENFIDSSLSVNEVVAWITSEAPGDMVDSSGDERIDSFGFENSCDPVGALKPFDVRFATSSWTRWDGIV
jgi:hypothetical protein